MATGLLTTGILLSAGATGYAGYKQSEAQKEAAKKAEEAAKAQAQLAAEQAPEQATNTSSNAVIKKDERPTGLQSQILSNKNISASDGYKDFTGQ